MTSSQTKLAFYGDDFTGSTDAMEVMALAGLQTVLFTRVPDPDLLAKFSGYDVTGIAGTSRARDPAWMEAHLPDVLAALCKLNPRIVQYKVCSTFDSAPEVGSIGRAIDIGLRQVCGSWSPSIVGAPQLGRWQVFGHLFARAGETVYRIDRHPTMSRHPITPMHESDLTVHLSHQTNRSVISIGMNELESFDPGSLPPDSPVVFLDVLDDRTQALAGHIVWQGSREQRLFMAASSGLQYALVAHWRATGELSEIPPDIPPPKPVARLLVLSGSCSPITASQIDIAEASGFSAIRLDVIAATDPARCDAELDRITREAAHAFETTPGVIILTARTVDDPAYDALMQAAKVRGSNPAQLQDEIGRFMGRIARDLAPRLELKRLVIAGGDTSGRVVESLPVDALEVVHPLAKGAPICRCHSADPRFNGLQIALKGGQIGDPRVFIEALEGFSR